MGETRAKQNSFANQQKRNIEMFNLKLAYLTLNKEVLNYVSHYIDVRKVPNVK